MFFAEICEILDHLDEELDDHDLATFILNFSIELGGVTVRQVAQTA